MSESKHTLEKSQAYLQKITGSPEGYTTAEVLQLRPWKYPGMYAVSRDFNWRFSGHGRFKLWCKADVDKYMQRYRNGFEAPPGWVTAKKAREILRMSDSALSIKATLNEWQRRKDPHDPLMYRWHDIHLAAEQRRKRGVI